MTSRFHLHPLAFPMLSALLLVAAAPLSIAYADPIPVNATSGYTFLSISGGEELSFGFFLPGVGNVSGYTAVDQGLHAEAFPAPLSLASGQPYTVSSTATFSSGQIMLDGEYGPVIPAWRVSGEFAFRGGTGSLVSETMDWGTQYVATAPFLFTGILNQFDWATGAQLHTFRLTGSGTGRAFLFDGREAGASPFVGYLEYDFAAPQPVPEPATLLLVAVGLTAAFARRNESRRRQAGGETLHSLRSDHGLTRRGERRIAPDSREVRENSTTVTITSDRLCRCLSSCRLSLCSPRVCYAGAPVSH